MILISVVQDHGVRLITLITIHYKKSNISQKEKAGVVYRAGPPGSLLSTPSLSNHVLPSSRFLVCDTSADIILLQRDLVPSQDDWKPRHTFVDDSHH